LPRRLGGERLRNAEELTWRNERDASDLSALSLLWAFLELCRASARSSRHCPLRDHRREARKQARRARSRMNHFERESSVHASQPLRTMPETFHFTGGASVSVDDIIKLINEKGHSHLLPLHVNSPNFPLAIERLLLVVQEIKIQGGRPSPCPPAPHPCTF
jgi:hypothetical protein